ncbi:unnamed protein product [Dovyalis caffra]|uniref:Protein TIFY n=1 Tax=Dovyalis caffra TaxID=77055 RepID=A0AAV1SIU4_9ROSI|nr:unnamed protein product [Dovyalis caffra]
MKRNCNLELRLLTSTDSDDHHHRYRPMVEAWNESPQSELKQQQQKQLTIFYNGRVLVCDVAELQARAILLIASREMEDKLQSPTGSEPAVSSPILRSRLYSPVGLSMKRSLQMFLQKRRHRIQAISPYNNVDNQLKRTGRFRNSVWREDQ